MAASLPTLASSRNKFAGLITHQVVATVATNTYVYRLCELSLRLCDGNFSAVIANREAVKQSRRKAAITQFSGLLRFARNDGMEDF
jgi:hypothetical protein